MTQQGMKQMNFCHSLLPPAQTLHSPTFEHAQSKDALEEKVQVVFQEFLCHRTLLHKELVFCDFI